MASEEEEEEEDQEEDDKAKPLVAPPCPPSQPLLIGSCSGFIETTVKLKQNDMLPGPKVCVVFPCELKAHYSSFLHRFLSSFILAHQLELDGKVGCIHMLLSPDQITHLTDLLAVLCIDTGIF